MSPLGRLLRRQLEKLLDRWSEGPNPPARYRREVEEFVSDHPTATANELIELAVAMAERAYREGYARGGEAGERGFDEPEVEPELVADRLYPGWRGSPPVDFRKGIGGVSVGESKPSAIRPETARALVREHSGGRR